MDPDDVKLMNCANCGRAMLGPSMLDIDDLPLPYGSPMFPHYCQHVNGRPWCEACVDYEKREAVGTHPVPPAVGGKPWGREMVHYNGDGAALMEDAIRSWEEAGE